MIRDVSLADAADICTIYNHYIEHSCITFDEECQSPQQIGHKIEHISERYPWLVYEENGRILGYAYAAEWKPRSAFRYTVETSIYLHPEAVGCGLGTPLYQALIDRLTGQGMHLVIAAITLPNAASIQLHRQFGFQEIGSMKHAGYKFDHWIDVSYWQLLL